MVSIRESNPDNRLHFGMGLYVVRIIAEHHGGNVKASNLYDGKGVSIKVTLPIFKPENLRPRRESSGLHPGNEIPATDE